MTAAAVLQALASVGAATVLATVINGVLNRKKLGAETTKIITDAASGVVANLEKDNDRLRRSEERVRLMLGDCEARLDDLEHAQAEWETERAEWLRVLELHAAWDHMAITKLREVVPPIDMPDPPPLTPPVRAKRR